VIRHILEYLFLLVFHIFGVIMRETFHMLLLS
jgi:hypothetical protein